MFDLSGITDTITSATLWLQCPDNCFDGPAGTYTIYDVSTPVSDLRAGGTGKFDIYDDLGSGVSFGSIVVSETDENSIITIDLNPDALAAVNTANGLFAFGGDFAAIGSSPNRVFSFTSADFCGGPCLRELVLDTTLAVGIDIKPGSFPNSINLGSGGVTPVAILGSADFDVSNVNPDSLTIATAGVKTVGNTMNSLCSVEDVSGPPPGPGGEDDPSGVPDGFLDLVCQFMTMDLVPEAGDTTATLAGELNDGTTIDGADSVNIVP